MKRTELEHIIRAAAAITNSQEIMVVGSQSILQNPNTDNKVGYCLEPHDLAASKLAAGREKDKTFVSTMLRLAVIEGATLGQRISTLPVAPEHREQLRLWVRGELERQSPAPAGKSG